MMRAVVLLRHVADARAPGSARCGSRGTGCRSAGPASGPRRAGTGRRGSARRASRAPSSRSRTGRSRRRRGRCRSRVNMTRGYSSSTVTAMYGNDLSSRRRTLNGGRWRLTRFCSRWSASTSVPVTITSRSAMRPGSCGIAARAVAARLEVRAHARPQRLRLADVEDVAALVAEEVDAGLRRQRFELVLESLWPSRASRSHARARRRGPARARRRWLALAPDARSRAARRCSSARPRTPRVGRRSPARRRRWTCSRLAGFDARPHHAEWAPGADGADTGRPDGARATSRRAAKLDAVTLCSRLPADRTTPLTPRTGALRAVRRRDRARPPDLRDFVVGNEPNLNRFWLPQFNEDGTDAAAPAYEALLATDVRRAEGGHRRRSRCYGGALAPRGGDGPASAAHTHSPTTFIQDMGAAYRASGRDDADHGRVRAPPVRGQLEHSRRPARTRTRRRSRSPTTRSSSPSLGKAFDGTAQAGSTLPILYDEFGVESQIPAEQGGALHRHRAADDEPGRRGDAGARTTGRRSQLAFCQPNVRGALLFHPSTSRRSTGWQSGLYYADGAPKTSLDATRKRRSTQARRGVDRALRRALQLTPHVSGVAYPRGSGLTAQQLAFG